MTIPFTHAYGSGHYSESASHLESWLLTAIKHSTLVAGTEVYGHPRTHALLYTLRSHNWGVHSGRNGDADQLYHAWDRSVWENTGREEHVLTTRSYTRVGGAQAPPNAALVDVLQHRDSGKVLLRIVFHLPAGIQGHTGPGGIFKNLPTRVGVYLSALHGVHKLRRDMVAKYHPDATMLGGDWNEDFANIAVRAFMKTVFPAATLNDKNFHGLGTLGKRFIDMFLLWHLAVMSDPVVRESVASDHRWYTQTLAFTT